MISLLNIVCPARTVIVVPKVSSAKIFWWPLYKGWLTTSSNCVRAKSATQLADVAPSSTL